MTNYTYINHIGDAMPLDKFHLHEMVDRLHIIQEMFNLTIVDHPCAGLLQSNIAEVNKLLGSLYQCAGLLEHEF